MCSKQGVIKKTSLEAYSRPRSNGINAITYANDDQSVTPCVTTINGNLAPPPQHV